MGCCYPDPAFGGIAQLVERLTGSQEVRGSNPLTSTEESQVRRWRAPRDPVPEIPSPRYPRANLGCLLGCLLGWLLVGRRRCASLDEIARCPMGRSSSLHGPPFAPRPWRRPPIGGRPDRGGRRCGDRWPDRDRGQPPRSRRAPLVEPSDWPPCAGARKALHRVEVRPARRPVARLCGASWRVGPSNRQAPRRSWRRNGRGRARSCATSVPRVRIEEPGPIANDASWCPPR